MTYSTAWTVISFYNIIPDTTGLGRTVLSVDGTFVERIELNHLESSSTVTAAGTEGAYFRMTEIGDPNGELNLLHITTGVDPVATTSSPMIQPGTYYSDFVWLPPGHKIAILPLANPDIPLLTPPEE